MLKNNKLQQDIDAIRNEIHTVAMTIMELKARIDNATADTRSKMDSIDKHIIPMHNRLDNMHSDISRISFNVQDAIKANKA